MCRLWIKKPLGRWQDEALNGDFIELGPEGPVALRRHEHFSGIAGLLLLRSHDGPDVERWVLLTTRHGGTRVNGESLPVGMRLLEHRDAIGLGPGRTVFFSSEEVAKVAPYLGTAEGACCSRCRDLLEQGQLVVRCPAPGCGFIHHESADHPCWTYADGCAACGHPTDLNAALQWTPADL